MRNSVIITGSSGKLGGRIATAMASEGFDVVLHYYSSEEKARKVAKKVEEFGAKALLVRADLSVEKGCRGLIKKSFSMHRPLVLINSAGTIAMKKIHEADVREVTESIAVNALAPFRLSMLFAEKAKEGKIVNITDAAPEDYRIKSFPYYMGKRSLDAVTEACAEALAPGISVNAIAIGPLIANRGEERYFKRYSRSLPLKKNSAVEDVIGALLFLIRSRSITGHTIRIDGGRNLRV